MKRITLKKIFTGTLLMMFLTSILFLSGFTYQDYPSVTETLIYNENGEEEQDEGDELDGEDGSNEEGDGEENKIEKWVCGKCGYVYDPENDDTEANVEPGTGFEDLPDDWVCPVCGASKDEFEFESEEHPDEDGRLARLRHVLAMRSKHIEVLQRVIEKMVYKDSMHPSIPALQHALQSSSKSIQKAQEAIDFFKGNINNSGNGTGNDDIDKENDNDETILENQEGGDEETAIMENSDAKENRGNSEDKRKDKKVKENNGRGRKK